MRRNIGRQVFHSTRLKVSVGIFVTLLLLVGGFSLRQPAVLGALFGGVALAIPVALYGLKLTKFEETPEGKFYTPNTALGIAISALFIGRLMYRIVVAGGLMGAPAPGSPALFQGPLTFFLFGLSAGYFVAYQTGVLIRSHRPAQS
jgi:hypothetical protein